MHDEIAVIPKPVPAPIPGRKVAPDAYSGIKFDTVGPALYNPNPDAQKPVAQKFDFVASKSKRTIFEQENKRENVLPSKENPGPGKYDPNDTRNQKQFNSSGNHSNFASRVPNCKGLKNKNATLPGPGSYNSKAMKHGDPSTLGSKAGASTDDSSTLTENQNPFLSKTGR